MRAGDGARRGAGATSPGTGGGALRFVPPNLPFVKNCFRGPSGLRKIRNTMKFDFEKFYQAVNAKRTARAASWRQVAREVGIGKSTLARMSQNKRPDADGLAALSFWAQLNPADFVFIDQLVEQPVASALRVSAASDDCPAARGGVITA